MNTEAHDTPAPASQRPSRLLPVALILSAVFLLVLVWQRPNIYAWWWTRQLVAATGDTEAHGYALRLQALGDRAVARLAPYADSDDEALRRRALRILAKVETPRSTSLLRRAAERELGEADLRLIIRALARRDDPAAQAIVAGAMVVVCDGEPDASAVRRACIAAHALALRGDDNARQLLVNALHCPGPPAVLVEVIHALIDLQESHCVPRLVQLLANEAAVEDVTERDRYAGEVLASVMGRPESAATVPAGAMLEVEPRHVVAQCADDALYILTERPRETVDTAPRTAAEIESAWRRWLAEHLPGAVPPLAEPNDPQRGAP